jgi:ornithine cyclodeaminase/alanine dehydrogenase-like protein (mu-crystallin family)
MPLFIKEEDVDALVGIEDAIGALENAFHHWRSDGTESLPRQRLPLPSPLRGFNVMAASLPAEDICGQKSYFGGCYHVMLYCISQKRLLAVIEASQLGAMRTGAASGVATRCLARDDASVVGIIGTGKQARTQLQAMNAIRALRAVRVFGRDVNRRKAFATKMAAELSCEVEPCDSPQDCISGAHIVITATNSREPVLHGDWLTPGVHINAIGANGYARRELDDAAVLRADRISTDDRDQARSEARELIDLSRAGKLDWDTVVELGDLVRKKAPGRDGANDVTLFKSLGVALEDLALAKVIYDRAVAASRGVTLGE